MVDCSADRLVERSVDMMAPLLIDQWDSSWGGWKADKRALKLVEWRDRLLIDS